MRKHIRMHAQIYETEFGHFFSFLEDKKQRHGIDKNHPRPPHNPCRLVRTDNAIIIFIEKTSINMILCIYLSPSLG